MRTRIFTACIIEAANNEALGTLINAIGSSVSWTTQFKHRYKAMPRDPLPDHIAVFDAINAKSRRKASDSMNKLLNRALEDMGISSKV